MEQPKKKIMLLVPMLHQGGFERVCVATARLLERYHDVCIVIFDDKDIAYDITGLHVINLNLGSKKGVFAKALQVFRRCVRTARLKKKMGIDVSYSFGLTAGLVNSLTCRNHRVWIGIRSYMDMENPGTIRLFCKFADKVLCCSKVIEKEIREKYHCQKAVTLYNPLNLEEIRQLSHRDKVKLPWQEGKVIVSMGREDEVKGFWHLIKIFYLVQKEIPDAKLLIIGEGEFNEYRKLAEELGIKDKVYFTGLQKNPYPYLRQGMLYLLTSYREGFPNALVEAMALEIPVVATDCMTGPREILEDRYGVLIPNMSPSVNWNPKEISDEEQKAAAVVKDLLKNDEKREEYRKLAVKRAGMFSSESYLKSLLELIESDCKDG